MPSAATTDMTFIMRVSPKKTTAKPNALPQCGPRPNRDWRRFLCRRNTDIDRKFEFTGVRIVSVRNFTQCDPRKALTSFRESETPGRARGDFSRLCPRRSLRAVSPAPRMEVPFFRHFSVMPGGIKTYSATPRKKLFGRP
jgi:hypothetical protein